MAISTEARRAARRGGDDGGAAGTLAARGGLRDALSTRDGPCGRRLAILVLAVTAGWPPDHCHCQSVRVSECQNVRMSVSEGRAVVGFKVRPRETDVPEVLDRGSYSGGPF